MDSELNVLSASNITTGRIDVPAGTIGNIRRFKVFREDGELLGYMDDGPGSSEALAKEHVMAMRMAMEQRKPSADCADTPPREPLVRPPALPS